MATKRPPLSIRVYPNPGANDKSIIIYAGDKFTASPTWKEIAPLDRDRYVMCGNMKTFVAGCPYGVAALYTHIGDTLYTALLLFYRKKASKKFMDLRSLSVFCKESKLPLSIASRLYPDLLALVRYDKSQLSNS